MSSYTCSLCVSICTYFTCVNEFFTARKPKTQVAGNPFNIYPVNQQLSQLPNQIEHHGRPSTFGEQPGKSIYSKLNHSIEVPQIFSVYMYKYLVILLDTIVND